MANPEHVAKLEEGIEEWNQWRRNNPSVSVDLRQAKFAAADLSRVDLRGVDLSWADLTAADLRDAKLSSADLKYVSLNDANLSNATLRGSNLRGANLIGAMLSETNLCGADLSESNIAGAVFIGAKLIAANFSEATLGMTTFAKSNLSGAKGLAHCEHVAPSSVDLDSFFGIIPVGFLRGCGVPEQFLILARSIAREPIALLSCFISYSSPDQSFAERLCGDLQARDLRCWFAPEDLKIGDRFPEKIEESIRSFDKVMIVLSENSVKSAWVQREVNAALERENRDNRKVLFPIQIDDAVMNATQPWADDLRCTRHIGDFGRWKDHDSYQKALEQLLSDLSAADSTWPTE